MDIKFTLTPQQIADIQKQAATAYSEAAALSAKARTKYNEAMGLRSTTPYTLSQLQAFLADIPGGAITLTATQVQQPATSPWPAWRKPDIVTAAYEFPSYSGQDPHKVLVGRNNDGSGERRTSCTCQAGKFGRECWAQKAVLKSVTTYSVPSIVYASGRPSGKRVQAWDRDDAWGTPK